MQRRNFKGIWSLAIRVLTLMTLSLKLRKQDKCIDPNAAQLLDIHGKLILRAVRQLYNECN